ELDGDSPSMADCQQAVIQLCERLSDLSDSSQVVQDIPGAGQAMDSLRTDASDLMVALDPPIEEARLLARVLQQYSNDYDTFAVRANAMISDIEQAHATWQQFRRKAQEAGEAALAAAEGDDDAATAAALEDSDAACADRDRAKQELDSLWEEYEGHYSGWEEAYDAALAALAGGRDELSKSERDLLEDLRNADNPQEVSEIWKEANQEERKHLQSLRPDIIGNLDGIPYDVRAAANKTRLRDLLASDDVDGETRQHLEALAEELKTGPPPPSLISFDPDGSEQVTAALAYGDLDSAEKINVLVPGMKSNVKGMGPWGTTAQEINEGVRGSATVAWFGYDSPDEFEEPLLGRAREGGRRLSSFLDGIDTLSPSATTSAIAHSYGSTTD